MVTDSESRSTPLTVTVTDHSPASRRTGLLDRLRGRRPGRTRRVVGSADGIVFMDAATGRQR